MTRRSHRALAGLSALWFAMLMMAGPMLHECAMHDGAASATTVPAQDHAMHGAHEQAPADDECEHCTCLGDCIGAAMAAATAQADRPTLRVSDRGGSTPASALAPSTGSPAVRLPFSVGPPLLA